MLPIARIAALAANPVEGLSSVREHGDEELFLARDLLDEIDLPPCDRSGAPARLKVPAHLALQKFFDFCHVKGGVPHAARPYAPLPDESAIAGGEEVEHALAQRTARLIQPDLNEGQQPVHPERVEPAELDVVEQMATARLECCTGTVDCAVALFVRRDPVKPGLRLPLETLKLFAAGSAADVLLVKRSGGECQGGRKDVRGGGRQR